MRSRVLTCIVSLLIFLTSALPFSHSQAHNEPHARFAHLAPTLQPIDIYVGSDLYVKALHYKEAPDFLEIDDPEVSVALVPAGAGMDKALTPQPILVAFPASEGQFFTVAIVGSLNDGTLDLVRLPGERASVSADTAQPGTGAAANIIVSDAWARATSLQQATPDGM